MFSWEGGSPDINIMQEAMKTFMGQSNHRFQAGPSTNTPLLPAPPALNREHSDINYTRARGHKKKNENNHSQDQKGNNRQHVGDPPEGFTHEDRLWCRNCRRPGHTLVRCVGPITEFGFIRGCGWCETVDHCTEACSYYQDLIPVEQKRFLAEIMLCKRRNRPPMECKVAPEKHELGMPGQKYEHFRPWSTTQSMSWKLDHIDDVYWKEYKYGSVHKPWEDPILAETEPKEIYFWPEHISHLGLRFEAWRKPAKQLDGKRKRAENESGDRPTKRPANAFATAGNNDGDADMEDVVPVEYLIENVRARLNKVHPKHCRNCGSDEHRSSACLANCGGCGNANHIQSNCPDSDEHCTCLMHPGHFAEDCTRICTQLCPANQKVSEKATETGVSPTVADMHTYVKCTRCGVCGSLTCSKSDIRQGPYFCSAKKSLTDGIRCLGCGSQHHFSDQCTEENLVGNWIPVHQNCPAMQCLNYFCRKHCFECYLEPSEGMHAHRHKVAGRLCPSVITTEAVPGNSGQSLDWVQCGREGHGKVKKGYPICPDCRPAEHAAWKKRSDAAKDKGA